MQIKAFFHLVGWFFSRNGAAVIPLDGILVEQSSCKLLVNCNMALSIILIYMHVWHGDFIA